MAKNLSVSKAIAAGLLAVNGPVLVLLLGPLALFAYAQKYGLLLPSQIWIALVVVVAGFVLAWLWWSFTIPKWRLWAYERVTDIIALKNAAVSVGLTWPDGHLFGRTEIKSKDHAARERAFDSSVDSSDGG